MVGGLYGVFLRYGSLFRVSLQSYVFFYVFMGVGAYVLGVL